MSRLAITLLCALFCLSRTAAAQDLVADLSDHVIAINTGFTGMRVVLFGAVAGPGDVAVVLRGPAQPITVREKGRVLGIWVNRESMAFAAVPSFYAVASSKPIEELASAAVLDRHDIGFEHLRLDPVDAEGASDAEVAAFRAALIRTMQADGLYDRQAGQVAFLGGRLFRTALNFPANVPTGQYTVEVFLFRDGQVADAQTTPLIVGKTGLGAGIYGFAQRDPALYGLAAIVVAVAAGWAASAVFRRA